MAEVIIIGGGLAGTVVASRLHQRRPELSIVLVEAGTDPSDHPHVINSADAGKLYFSELDYKYFTAPQKHLDGKPKYNCAVKALGGGTVINTGGWIRGDADDYNDWAELVGDSRWSYEGLLPYFKRSERHFDPDAEKSQHGFDGPMHTASVSSSGRRFPLRDHVLKLWAGLGLQHIHDLNDGRPQGISDLVENWRDGKRQVAQSVYSLDGVRVLTKTLVKRVIISDEKIATGIELAGGEKIHLKPDGQVILSAGTYRTPQILMLSGIGDPVHLSQHNLPVTVPNPSVGQNLHDHLGLFRYWKLKHPEQGLALGHPGFSGANYDKGGPVDFLVRNPIPTEALKSALEKDEGNIPNDTHPLLRGPRTHLEMLLLYAALGSETQGLQLPLDGTSITTFVMGCLPTSRGSITLASSDPADAPLIDPNYFATETDRHVLREGVRMQTRVMLDTAAGKELVDAEHTPPDMAVLGLHASDAQIDARIKMGAGTVFHPGGTASMGSVVDASLNVYGVRGLRVVDASVIPKPLAAHYQVPVYALAEQAVDIILAEDFAV